MTFAEAYPVDIKQRREVNSGPGNLPPEACPGNSAPGSNRRLECCPWEAKDLQELRKAVAEDGPNSPWAQTLLQDIAHHPCVPEGWLVVAKAVLASPQFITWCAVSKEECRVRAEANRAAQPATPITYAMQAGRGGILYPLCALHR